MTNTIWYHATPVENVALIEREGLRGDLCIDGGVHLGNRDRSSLVWSLHLSDEWADERDEYDDELGGKLIALFQVSLEGIDPALVLEGIDDPHDDRLVMATIPAEKLEANPLKGCTRTSQWRTMVLPTQRTENDMMKVRALEIESESNAAKSYRVAVDSKGVISCSCPSWKFKTVAIELRSCKHIAFLKSTLLARTLG